VPTFDHGKTILYAVRSALAQTVEDIEVFIVGDGVPKPAREFIDLLLREDSRVRFFANPKGPRHGEIYRAKALEEASGEIVCYLSDDDLWLPNHLESMLELLAEADFANCLPLRVEPDGSLAGWTVNLAEESFRQLLLSGENRVPLSCSGHTLSAYRRLPVGWRTTPDDVPTDLYMFQQFLSEERVRTVSGTTPSCLHFPSPDRVGWTVEKRCTELDRWQTRVRDEKWRALELPLLAMKVQVSGWSNRDAKARALWRQQEECAKALSNVTESYRDLENKYWRLEENRSELEEQLHEKSDEAAELSSRAEAMAGRIDDAEARVQDSERMLGDAHFELEWMRASRTWRLRSWILSLPGVGAIVRWVAGARSRRAAR
jgi:hypothetical protein